VARHAPTGCLASTLVWLVTITADELLFSIGGTVLHVALVFMTALARSRVDPGLRVRPMACRAAHRLVDINLLGIPQTILFPMAAGALPRRLPNARTSSEIVAREAMRRSHSRDRDVNVVVAFGTAFGNRIAEALDLAEVTAGARLLRTPVVRDVVPNCFCASTPLRIRSLLLVALGATRASSSVWIRGGNRRRCRRDAGVAVTLGASAEQPRSEDGNGQRQCPNETEAMARVDHRPAW